jgi:DnaK suppressor protein
METDFLRRIHDVLADMRQHIVDAAHAEIVEKVEDEGDGPGDVFDVASAERTRELQALLTHRDRDKLIAIDQALARLDAGDYGVCDECEEEIAAGRLELLPFTRLCVTCQAAHEREAAQHRPAGAAVRPSLDLSALETDDE